MHGILKTPVSTTIIVRFPLAINICIYAVEFTGILD